MYRRRSSRPTCQVYRPNMPSSGRGVTAQCFFPDLWPTLPKGAARRFLRSYGPAADSPMTHEVDFYDGLYGHLATDPQVEVRRETYGEDLGQASWITASEARRWFNLLQLHCGQRVLEVGCGSGGVTCAMAHHIGAACVGVDINVQGIEAAKNRAERDGISALVSFQVVDAAAVCRLPPSPSMPCSAMTLSIIFRPCRSASRLVSPAPARRPRPVHRSNCCDGSTVKRGDSRTELHRILSFHSRGAQRAPAGTGWVHNTRRAGRYRRRRVSLAEMAGCPGAQARATRAAGGRRRLRGSPALSGRSVHSRRERRLSRYMYLAEE